MGILKGDKLGVWELVMGFIELMAEGLKSLAEEERAALTSIFSEVASWEKMINEIMKANFKYTIEKIIEILIL